MLHALRSLLRAPGFTCIALMTLAIGIGVNTSMVSLVQALLFRSAPFPDADRLVQILGAAPTGRVEVFSAVEIREITAQTDAFDTLTVLGGTRFVASEQGHGTERLTGMYATADLFSTFGMQPMLGRAFTAEEAQAGRNSVIVISHTFWQSRYGGRSDALGRTLRLDGEPVEIIGVMPPEFEYRMLWGNTQLWRPLAYTKEQLEWRDYRTFQLIGKMRSPGAAPQIASSLANLAVEQAKGHPQTYGGFRYRVLPLHEALMDDTGRRISWMLLGLSGFVLLIACANLANLQLARATAGARDLAIRAALGASRARLVLRQLGESLILVVGGTLLGLLVAQGINSVVESRFLIDGRAGLTVTMDGPVLALTALVALITGVLFGILPAWFASRTNVQTVLKGQARGSTTGRGHNRMRQALVVCEITLAVALLGGAGVMHRSFEKFLTRETGWDTARVLSGTLPVPETRFANEDARMAFYRQVEARLAAIPGAERAAIATSMPVFDYNGERQVLVEGQAPGSAENFPSAFHVMVTSGYFATVGIQLVEGRLFPEDIKASDPRVVVVNETLARQLWPGRSAVGQRLCSMDSGYAFWAEVIGVVRDVESAATVRPPATRLVVYKPLAHEAWGWVHLIVRSEKPETLAHAFRQAMEEIDPEMPADWISTVPQKIEGSQQNLRLAATTLTWFAALGLGLAALGIYGVISHLVAQRTGEFGIRMALGAQQTDVFQLVLRHGVLLTVIGVIIGLAGALAVTRVLHTIMPRLVGLDLPALALVAVGLLGVAIVACLVPARRATKVDPLDALRAE
ncbi:MAG: ABC transporter permease [Opitutaceae bacterium]|nr:ABC transporter permease [Opitutaceae bacterium]